MRFFKYILLLFLAVSSLQLSAQSLRELEKQKDELRRKIDETNKLLERNAQNTENSILQIETLKSKISLQKQYLAKISQEIYFTGVLLDSLAKDIKDRSLKIDSIKLEYSKLVYHAWKMDKSGNEMMYVFAGANLNQVYRRFRYFAEFSAYRKKQGEEIKVQLVQLEEKKVTLEEEKRKKQILSHQYTLEEKELAKTQEETEVQLTQLKSQDKKLRSDLAEHQKKIKNLERFIAKAIQDELNRRKKATTGKESPDGLTPEERIVSNQFEGNAGRLPWPVAKGKIVLRFGLYTPEGMSNVTVPSNGIDLETDKDASVRAIFQGEVTGVYALPGYNKGVIVRHGKYLSFYANLSEVSVKKGDKVVTKQTIGKIYTDPIINKSVLHFEIYNGQKIENPEKWLAK